MKISLLGGLRVEHDGRVIAVSGAMQLAVLFRLTVDAGHAVSYRAIAEDVWGLDAPENTKASLQSIVSRLRPQLPPGSIESTAGGYRLVVRPGDVDALQFTDLVAAAERAGDASTARRALELWAGEPWIPSQNFDWFVRDLTRDHAVAMQLCGVREAPEATPSLPAQLTTLVGRESELRAIADQLAGNRLVTIIGTGGAGKTRLAIEAATRQGSALFVELAPAGPSEVIGAVLAATGRELRSAETTGESTRTRLLEALAGRELLLVLDNCEHVIEAAAVLAQDLLSALPRLRILATSREHLGVPGEAFVGLGSLPHPTESEISASSPAQLANFAAVELFGQRALAAHGRALGTDDIVIAASICARLDGLPLAIELAAAKMRTMEPAEVLAGLDDRFTLLTGGYRTAMPRHQTLRAMIDWSWSLLDEAERRALLGLSVFPAGVGVADAGLLAVALDLPGPSVFDSLVDRSLLQRARGRFRELETIREYGIERLSREGSLADARTAQALFMTERADTVDRRLRGPAIMDAIAWFDDEEDNLGGALRFAVGAPLPPLVVRLAVSCTWYWVLRDRNEEAVAWIRAASEAAALVDGDEARVLALVHPLLENVSGREGDHVDLATLGSRLERLREPLRRVELRAGSHEMLQLMAPGLVAFAEVANRENWLWAVRLPRGEDLGLDAWPTAMLHVMRAGAAQNRGDMAELGRESLLAIEQFSTSGDRWGLALSQRMRAEWLTVNGHLEAALEHSDSSTDIMRAITSAPDLAREQGLSIQLLWRLGRADEARRRAATMLSQTEASGDPRAILHAQVNALLLDVSLLDVASATARVAVIDELVAVSPPNIQTLAVLQTAKAALARERGDVDTARDLLRAAVASALSTSDHPIIGAVAMGVGMLALHSGDVAMAVRAADFASAIVGACDATHPDLVAISAAAEREEIAGPRLEVTERPASLEVLTDLIA